MSSSHRSLLRNPMVRFVSLLKHQPAECVLACVRKDLADDSETFGPTFSEQNGSSDLEVLRPVHKSELNEARISGPHQILVHFDDLGTLTNNSAVDHCLVVRFDCGCVMQNLNLSFEIVNAFWLNVFVKHNHAFSKVGSLEGVFLLQTFNGKANCLASPGFFNWDSLVVDRLDHHWFELAQFIRSQIQNSVWRYCARFQSSCHDHADTSNLVDAIDVELNRIIRRSEQS